MNFCQPTTLSLTQLFDQWRIASDREEIKRILLESEPENDAYAEDFSRWNLHRKIIYAEIERRADMFEMELLNHLMDTCTNFYFNDRPGL